MKKVFIVREGQYDSFTQSDDYKNLIDSLVELLVRTTSRADEVSVEVAPTAESIVSRINRERIDVVIFVSRDMARVAEDFAKIFPMTRIVVLTGLIPEGKIIWLDKNWCNSEIIRKVVFS